MQRSFTKIGQLIFSSLPWLCLAILAIYTYAFFFQLPYAGFSFSGPKSEIFLVYSSPDQISTIHLGDELIEIGGIKTYIFRDDIYLTLFDGIQPGDVVPIRVLRGTEYLTIEWPFPGFTEIEFRERIISQWWLSYVFWLVGTATFLLVRPKDERWRLLVAFNFLTALWMAAGPGPSSMHIWGGLLVLRAAIWLSAPVLVHLHWVFPSPLQRLPRYSWGALYAIAVTFALGEVIQFTPRSSYQIAFLLAMLVSLLLLILHYLLRKKDRINIRLILISATIAFGPAITLTTVVPESSASFLIRGASVITLPALPAAYFYAVYRRQLGGLELRANRLISIYLFMVILATSFLILIPLADTYISFPGATTIVAIASALLSAIFAVAFFNPFQRFVERRVLGMPLPPTHLIQEHAARITTSLTFTTLNELITENILPSLLIRQSALVVLDENEGIRDLIRSGIEDTDLPSDSDIPQLLSLASRYRPPFVEQENTNFFPWIRLVLPLYGGERLLGLWLLGRHDPDDFYSQAEIVTLQSLANQTAIALTNIYQADQLRALYQANIDRHEGERSRLAHDLHDVVLNQLGLMFTTMEDETAAKKIEAQHREITNHLREIIQDLRPAMLDFGLYSAIVEFADILSDRPAVDMKVTVAIPTSEVHFDPSVELHIFRIVQQACENAIRYSQGSELQIRGRIEPIGIQISIEDNGVGFQAEPSKDLVTLLAGKHFGLASMMERAELIKARVDIVSNPQAGTKVNIFWKQEPT